MVLGTFRNPYILYIFNICAEEDVYHIIVAWIERDMNERMEYFTEGALPWEDPD